MSAPAPGSPQWMRLVTASKVAAILGLSPWESPRSMWHKMRGELTDDGSNAEAKERGHYLEAGVVAWWKDQHPNLGETAEQVYNRLEDWGAATPDLVGDDDGYGNEFVMDAKTAATDDDWGDEPPAYYLAQSVWQLACNPSAQVAYIAVLFGRPRMGFREYVIQRDDALIEHVVAKCREFYDSLAGDTPPPLSDHVADYDAIRKVHVDIDRGEAVDIPTDLADAYLTAKAHEKRLPILSAQLAEAMGRAQYARTNGQTIARRQPKGDAVTLVRVAPLPDLTGDAA